MKVSESRVNTSFLKDAIRLYKCGNIVQVVYPSDTKESVAKGNLGIVGSVPEGFKPYERIVLCNLQVGVVKIQIEITSDGNITAYNYGDAISKGTTCRYSGCYIVN